LRQRAQRARIVAMEIRCPACGEPNPERAKFCLECGSPVTFDPDDRDAILACFERLRAAS
jgi:rRNA maturation endonuclease Nob1